MNECQQLGLINRISNGYELKAGCFINPVVRKTDIEIYKEICEFCKAKGVAIPNWNKRALSVLLTKYNAIGVSKTEPISLTYQLNKRCENLPEKVSLPYFIKVLDMQKQYRDVIKQDMQNKDEFKGFAF